MNQLAIYEHGDLTAQKSHESCEVHLGRPEREGDQVEEVCWCFQVIVPTTPLTTTTTTTTTNTLTWRSDLVSSLETRSHGWVPAGHPRYTRDPEREEAVGGSTMRAPSGGKSRRRRQVSQQFLREFKCALFVFCPNAECVCAWCYLRVSAKCVVRCVFCTCAKCGCSLCFFFALDLSG